MTIDKKLMLEGEPMTRREILAARPGGGTGWGNRGCNCA